MDNEVLCLIVKELNKNGVKLIKHDFSNIDTFNPENADYYYSMAGELPQIFDFTEHDRVFEDEIERLKRQIKKLESIRTRCHESARDSFDLGNYGCLHIVTADELKTTKDVNDRMVELPFDALETANMLINAKYRSKAKGMDRFLCRDGYMLETDMYSVDDLKQIAEHLLVYCKHNSEGE